mmetsp:Transcript_11082/g.33224  ORF Transcript_11082/g.33224 Transcript_11082/m.33224 type:complete len:205 (-) Transcript_11082:281-895(-)
MPGGLWWSRGPRRSAQRRRRRRPPPSSGHWPCWPPCPARMLTGGPRLPPPHSASPHPQPLRHLCWTRSHRQHHPALPSLLASATAWPGAMLPRLLPPSDYQRRAGPLRARSIVQSLACCRDQCREFRSRQVSGRAGLPSGSQHHVGQGVIVHGGGLAPPQHLRQLRGQLVLAHVDLTVAALRNKCAHCCHLLDDLQCLPGNFPK